MISVTFLVACQSRPVPPEVHDDMAIAQIDDQLILASQFMKEVQRIEEKTPQVLSTYIQKKELLDQWINVELLADAALEAGFMNDFRFKTKLAEAYVEDLADEAQKSLKPELVEAFYETHRKKFDQISARHILLKTSPGMSEKEKIEKFRALEKIRAELIQSPQDFADFARRHSEDTSARQGGDLGFFSYEDMVPEFSKAAFALNQPLDISPVISSPFGYHIIQLQDARKGFENFKSQIESQMIRNSRQNILAQKIESLRRGRNIKTFEDNLLKLSPLPDGILDSPDNVLPRDLKKDDETDE